MTIARARRYEICHLFASPLEGESRMFKELATAEKIFPADALLAIGLDKGTGELTGKLQGRYPYERIRLSTQNLPKSLPFQLVKYVEWTLRAASRARASGAKILHCHSLPALPAAVLAARFGRARILYDAHELESKRANFSKLKQHLTAALERMLMRSVDELLVVSPSIANHYKSAYPGREVSLLMNIPRAEGNATGLDIRKKLDLGNDKFLVVYIGGFSRGRGIELLLESFSQLDDPFHLVFLGNGVLADEIDQAAKSQTNVHRLLPVQEREVVPTVAGADLSFSVNDCDSLNHQFSLPNKFFQSLMAGVPIVVNDGNADMLAIGRDTGMVFGVSYTATAVREFITSFAARKVPRSTQSWSWEAQEHILASVYRRLAEMR